MDRVKYTSPLVSVAVITFNSSKYILEALESIYTQTYQNIELIISDDCSTDDTVDICENWVKEHKERFVRIEIIEANNNTGLPANCNRGLSKATGVWIKYVAGDDILLPKCINSNINYIENQDSANVVHSVSRAYNEKFSEESYIASTPRNTEINNERTAYEQFNILKLSCPINAATVFFKKDYLIGCKGFNEQYEFEDWVFWLMITEMGERIHFLNEETAGYRYRMTSITRENSHDRIFSDLYKKQYVFYNNYLKSRINPLSRFYYKCNYGRYNFFSKFGLNKKKFLPVIFFKLTSIPIKLLYHLTYFIQTKN